MLTSKVTKANLEICDKYCITIKLQNRLSDSSLTILVRDSFSEDPEKESTPADCYTLLPVLKTVIGNKKWPNIRALLNGMLI